MEGHLDEIVKAANGIVKAAIGIKEEYAKMKKAHEDRLTALETRINDLEGDRNEFKKAVSNKALHVQVKVEEIASHTSQVQEKFKSNQYGLGDATTIGHINRGADLANECVNETGDLIQIIRGGVVKEDEPSKSVA